MGAKLYADTATKTLIGTLAPDGNGFIDLSAQVDFWSDLIEDWQADVNLRKFTFPFIAIGGQTISSGKLGTTYVLLEPWQYAPYEADQGLNIDGNLFTELALTSLVLPTIGAYTVVVSRNLSTLVEVVESGTSGLTPTESQALIDIDTNVDGLVTDVADLEAKIDLLLSAQDLTNAQEEAEHTTNASTGKIIVRNTVTLQRWEADAWEDADQTIAYKGEGLESIGQLTQVAWS